jgi:hypothetical protein
LFLPRWERSQSDSFDFTDTKFFFAEAQPVEVNKAIKRSTNTYSNILTVFRIIKYTFKLSIQFTKYFDIIK